MTKTVKRVPIKKMGSTDKKQVHSAGRESGSKFFTAIFVIALFAVAAYFLAPNLASDVMSSGAIDSIKNMFADKGPVAAKVNGQEIYVSEIDAQFEQIPEMFREGISKDLILDQIISQEVLVQEAESMKLKVTRSEVESFVDAAIIKSGWTREKFAEVLAQQGMSMEELKKLYGVTLLIEKLLNESVLSKIDISDADVEVYYQENIDAFLYPADMVQAEHILIRVGEEEDSHTDEEALGIISDIRSQIVDDGVDFQDAAFKSSEDPSAVSNKGDLGFFEYSAMVPEFADVAFALENIDDISEPVKTSFGYHIIKLTGKVSEGDVQSLEGISSMIKQNLLAEEQRTSVEEYIATLRENSDIKKLGEYDPTAKPEDETTEDIDTEATTESDVESEEVMESVEADVEADADAEMLDEVSDDMDKIAEGTQ